MVRTLVVVSVAGMLCMGCCPHEQIATAAREYREVVLPRHVEYLERDEGITDGERDAALHHARQLGALLGEISDG